MDKKQVKSILMNLRTNENSNIVNNLLAKLDLLDEVTFRKIIEKAGTSEETIKKALQDRISRAMEKAKHNSKTYPLNDMFYYGITNDCVHIHLVPKDLHSLLAIGPEYLVSIHNLYMLDAINKLKDLKLSGHPRFASLKNVYMISPIFHSPTFEEQKELAFLKDFLFEVHSYTSDQLKDDKFVSENQEAQLAKTIFGDKKSVATAIASFDTIASEEWQVKKIKKFEEFAHRGITLPDENIEHP